MKSTTLSIGEKLRKLRGTKTKNEVAQAIGVSFSTYVKWERNERRPSDSMKVAISKYYGKSIENIFFT